MGNNTLADQFRESNLRFVNYLYSFLLHKEKSESYKLSKLKEELQLFTNEMRIVWLIEKINDEII